MTLFGSLLGSVSGQKSEKVEYGKTNEKVVEYFHASHAVNSETGPCGPLKELKKSAILRDWPQGAVLKASGNQQLATGNQQLEIGA